MKKNLSIVLLSVIMVFVSCEKEDTVVVSEVKLSKTSLELTKGFSETLIATVMPESANDKAVVWSSSNPDVATVTETGKVTGITADTATISVTTVNGSKTAICQVKVTPQTATLGLGSNTYDVNEYTENGRAEIPFSIEHEMLGNITCTVIAIDGTAVNTGDAWDYKLPNAEATIEKGSTEGKIIIDLQDAYAQKEDRSFKLRITAVESDCENEEISIASNLWECEVIIKKVIREALFAQPLITASKQMSTVDLGLSLTGPVQQDVTLIFNAKPGATAVEGHDFTIESHQVTIPAGKIRASTKVTILNDIDGFCEFEITEVTGNVDVAIDNTCRLEIKKNQK